MKLTSVTFCVLMGAVKGELFILGFTQCVQGGCAKSDSLQAQLSAIPVGHTWLSG